MSEVRIRENESLESAPRRFKRKTARDGILAKGRFSFSIEIFRLVSSMPDEFLYRICKS